jgi:hypothetical protein
MSSRAAKTSRTVAPKKEVVVAPEPEKKEKTLPVHTVMSQSRVRKHLDKLNVNQSITNEIKALNATVAKYKKALHITSGKAQFANKINTNNGPPSEEEIEEAKLLLSKMTNAEKTALDKITALTSEKIRFSKETSVVLSVIMDKLVLDLVTFAEQRVSAQEGRLITPDVLHDPLVEQLPLFPLISQLPSYIKREKKVVQKRIEDAVYAALKAKQDVCNKAHKSSAAKVRAALKSLNDPDLSKKVISALDEVRDSVRVKEQQKAEKVKSEDVPASDSEDNAATFDFYVNLICKSVVSKKPQTETTPETPAVPSIRVSTEFRKYVSDLLVEFISRTAQILCVQIDSMNLKTVSESAVLGTVKLMLAEARKNESSVKVVKKKVPQKEAHEAEKKKKAEAKKQGEEYEYDVNKLPQVDALEAVKTTDYSKCGYDELVKVIAERREEALERVAASK